MRFREIREVKDEERIRQNNKDLPFLKIKPENNTTFEDATNFINELFNKN